MIRQRVLGLLLAISATLVVVGLLRLGLHGHGNLGPLGMVRLAGLAVAIAVALLTLVRPPRHRLYAAIAVIGVAPMAQVVYQYGDLLLFRIAVLKIPPASLVLFGMLSAFVSALGLLLARPPQALPDPVARAVAQPRSTG